METQDYAIAALEPEQLDELRTMERRLSERAGHPISLVAYEAAPGSTDSD
ncbi:hypothetical protein [Cohnella boryungensis]|jgi:hypothetical protein|uniref:Uncharacterized protein n=1 Tax=Cohnella boryungensis TaxID=768479 RepID=A0ABV8S716_9BACL